MSQRLSRRIFLAMTGAVIAAPRCTWASNEAPALLDHILLGCNDLDKGIAFVEEKTGVRAAFGGVHPGRGTRNALLSLGDRHYLEIIAPDPAQPNATESLSLALKKLTAPRLVGWAAHPGDIDAFANKLRDARLAFEGPRPGSRQRPDGRVLQWKSLSLEDDRGGVLPFFIQWSADSVHPSADAPAGCKIVNFEMSGPDPGEINRLCKLMDLDVPVGRSEKLQLRARIAGPGGKVLDVTS
jgi:catechol 2,3-dioxygenase-like lactoylglutathione lyase family enzyme